MVSKADTSACCLIKMTWAAGCNTWLPIKLVPKGVVFSFLFLSLSKMCSLIRQGRGGDGLGFGEGYELGLVFGGQRYHKVSCNVLMWVIMVIIIIRGAGEG